MVVAMEQRESEYSTSEPRYSKGTDDGGEVLGRVGQLQVAKEGASTETDLGIALIGSTCSTRSQAARRSTRAIPGSQVACGAINGEFTAVWCFYCSVWPFLPISPPSRSWVFEEKNVAQCNVRFEAFRLNVI